MTFIIIIIIHISQDGLVHVHKVRFISKSSVDQKMGEKDAIKRDLLAASMIT